MKCRTEPSLFLSSALMFSYCNEHFYCEDPNECGSSYSLWSEMRGLYYSRILKDTSNLTYSIKLCQLELKFLFQLIMQLLKQFYRHLIVLNQGISVVVVSAL